MYSMSPMTASTAVQLPHGLLDWSTWNEGKHTNILRLVETFVQQMGLKRLLTTGITTTTNRSTLDIRMHFGMNRNFDLHNLNPLKTANTAKKPIKANAKKKIPKNHKLHGSRSSVFSYLLSQTALETDRDVSDGTLTRVKQCVLENWKNMRRDLRAADPQATGLIDPTQCKQVQSGTKKKKKKKKKKQQLKFSGEEPRSLFFSVLGQGVIIWVVLFLGCEINLSQASPSSLGFFQRRAEMPGLPLIKCLAFPQVLRNYSVNLSEEEFEALRELHERGIAGKMNYNEFFRWALKDACS